MDFSSFKRFVPDDEEEVEVQDAVDESNEDVIAKLLRTAEKRKKKRLKTSKRDKTDDGHDIAVEDKTSLDEGAKNISNQKEISKDQDGNTSEEDPENAELNGNATENTDGGFTVIGEVKPLKAKPVKAPLPKWIRAPIVFDKDGDNANEQPENFADHLSVNLIKRLADNGITGLFSVQKAIIPFLSRQFTASRSVRPRDICVSSPTGSGKTLAFVLPIINHLQSRIETSVRVVVVLPVRDLAMQVFKVFEAYCKGSSLRAGCAVGHRSLAEDIDALIYRKLDGTHRSNVDILVCTPGRLVDLIHRAPGFDLTELTMLVLDEADRMMGAELEYNWMEEIDRAVYSNSMLNSDIACSCRLNADLSKRCSFDCRTGCSLSNYSLSTRSVQKILFSATLSNDPVKLQGIKLFEPQLFVASQKANSNKKGDATNSDVTTSQMPSALKEQMIIVQEDKKPLVLWHLIENLHYRRILCFTGSVENTHRLYILLKNIPNIKIAEVSSHLSPDQRDVLLEKFDNDELDLIVCSDIMARGIDLNNVSYVVCYDPPNNETAYVHRIGRTARAGKSGIALTLLTPSQMGMFQGIIRKAHKNSSSSAGTEEKRHAVDKMTIQQRHLKKLIPKYKEALKKLQSTVANKSALRKKAVQSEQTVTASNL